jgi:hypothetical protein
MSSVDPTENEDQNEPEPAAAGPEVSTEGGESAAEVDKGPPTRRRDSKFRLELIRRLPRMSFASWSAKDNFKLDEEWGGVISLQSDVILGPLEAVTKDRRG